uniref:SUN domain-containing protein 2-like n=1 Tax=Phallusia mammillata TaxID=59560 RepID=A0A6F9DUQ4_9ASCI|nr:SUN domain-containing protein 2-like [Phallusia mammillata]
MSRTHGFTSPSRRSKRLLQSGYYQPPVNDNESNLAAPSDDDDTASIDSNMSRSSFATENRNVIYKESPPLRKFNRHRRRNHSGSPARSPGLPTVNRVTFLKEQETHRHVQFSSSQSTSHVPSRLRDATALPGQVHSHNIPHLYGLQQEEEESFASGEGVNRTVVTQSTINRTNMQVVDGSQASQGDVFKTPALVHRRPIGKYPSSLSDDESETFQQSDSSDKNTVTSHNPFLIVYQTLLLLFSLISGLLWKVGKLIYENTTKILLLDTWLLTHGIQISALQQYLSKLLKLFVLALFIAAACYLFLSLPRLNHKTTPAVAQPMQTGSAPEKYKVDLMIKTLEEKYSKDIQDHQKSLEQTIQALEYSLQQLELKIVDRQSTLDSKIDRLETKHHKSLEDVSKTSEKLSSVASVIDKSVSDKTKELEFSFTQKLNALQMRIEQLKNEHGNSILDLKENMDGKFNEVATKSQRFQTQMEQFENYLKSFTGKIGAVEKETRKLDLSFQQTSNITYLKEVFDKSFTENFLLLLQQGSAESTKLPKSKHTHLSMVFLEWLKARGFVKEVDLLNAYKKSNQSFSALVGKLKMETDHKIQASIAQKKRESSITLDSITSSKSLNQNLVTEAMVKFWIQEALNVFSADKIGKPDFALESSGGFIVNTRCSETYHHKTALVSILGIPIYYNINTPRAVIQPNVLPGDCWAFKGSEGYVVIGLSAAVHPTSFSLEHIPKSLALYNNIESAPKDFTVHGLNEPTDTEGNLLGVFRYDEDGSALQTFTIDPSHDSGRNFSYIELRIASNWGHKDFTCLYRFRVHGVKM